MSPLAGADLDSCLSCHHPMLDGRRAHIPQKDGDCTACHQPAASGAPGKCLSPKAAAWQLTAEQPALCARCHDTTALSPHPAIESQPALAKSSPLRVFGVGPWHPVIKSQGCTGCHDPHASNNPALAKIWPVEALCAKCHTKYNDAQFIHTPVKKGECLGCHSPHASEVKALLLSNREELCARCHITADLMVGAVKHQPVALGHCLSCHDPHQSDDKDQLVDHGKKLCMSCHDSKAKPGAATASPAFQIDLSKKFVHKPVATGDCQACHTQAHSSEIPHLLLKPGNELCISCHAAQANPAHTWAPQDAVKAFVCTECHNPHGSDNPKLLKLLTLLPKGPRK